MRVALVHDWLTGTRGGERVLAALAELLPEPDVFTLLHVPGTSPAAIERLRITTSFIGALPGVRHYYRYCLPLFPSAVERLDLRGYDLVVSSSHCVAKSVRVPDGVHVSYCHTPMRYAWDQRSAYFHTGGAPYLRRLLISPMLERLRRWDARTAQRVNLFVANSENVRSRIARFYGMDARVVHPPVQVERFAPAAEREDRYVCAGALVPYKRVDLAVVAFNESGRPLLVVGDGPEYRRLRRVARPNITFAGQVADSEMAAILGRARALVMPMVEDFGITAVEAQAAGAPVLAFAAGGALETVVPGITGVFFGQQSTSSLNHAADRFERMSFDESVLRRHAAQFDGTAFRIGMRAALSTLVPTPRPRAVRAVV
jgi:glycosyltransferase involved in cell wall biosynthesis